MLYYRGSRFLRFVIIPLTLVAFLPACHKWVPLSRPFDQAIADDRPTLIRATDNDGVQIEMKSPWVRGDTLYGLPSRGDSRKPGDVIAVDTVTVGLSGLTRIEHRGSNGLGTAGVVMGGIVGLLVVIGAGFEGPGA